MHVLDCACTRAHSPHPRGVLRPAFVLNRHDRCDRSELYFRPCAGSFDRLKNAMKLIFVRQVMAPLIDGRAYALRIARGGDHGGDADGDVSQTTRTAFFHLGERTRASFLHPVVSRGFYGKLF